LMVVGYRRMHVEVISGMLGMVGGKNNGGKIF